MFREDICDAILSLNKFEYFLIDKEFKIVFFSDNINRYFDNITDKTILTDIREYLPEIYGMEDDILKNKNYNIPVVMKKDNYIDIFFYKKENLIIVLLENVTEKVLLEQKLVQKENDLDLLLQQSESKLLDDDIDIEIEV